jgi:hypothetical protein
MSGARKWRRILQSAVVASGPFFAFAFGLFALEGRTLASTLFGDVFFAVAFSIIPVVVGFPILVGIGFLVRLIAERLLKRRIPGRTYAPCLIPAVLGVACVGGSFLLDRSPRKLFHDYLNTDPPASLSNFQYWWDTLPGDTLYVFSFDLAPSDFNKLLANHQFVEDSNPEDIRQALKENFPTGLPGLNIQLPQAPLIIMYKYSTENPPGLPHIINVFTTEKRHQVVICGDN